VGFAFMAKQVVVRVAVPFCEELLEDMFITKLVKAEVALTSLCED
jgi:hypothetical protein